MKVEGENECRRAEGRRQVQGSMENQKIDQMELESKFTLETPRPPALSSALSLCFKQRQLQHSFTSTWCAKPILNDPLKSFLTDRLPTGINTTCV